MQKKLDLSLYLVLDPDLCGGIDGMVNTVKIAVDNGVTVVQLRSEHEFDRLDWYRAALALKTVLQDTPVPLIINDGVHVGQRDLPVDVARKLIGVDKFLGLSISNQQQLERVNWQYVDYLGIGPVFPTTTKQDAAPAIELAELAKLNHLKRCPAVAIGGINLQNLTPILEMGIEGIAVVSAICGQPDIARSTKQLAHKINQIQQGINR